MQEINKVGIYCRLSRDDERVGESVSIENQKELLTRHAREQGWTVFDYYVDMYNQRLIQCPAHMGTEKRLK